MWALAAAVLLAGMFAAGCRRSTVPVPPDGKTTVSTAVTVPSSPSTTVMTAGTTTSMAGPAQSVGRWDPIPPADAALDSPTAVWTGDVMVLLGVARDGGAAAREYDPQTGTWSEIAPPPQVRLQPAAVWTGTRLLIWGGEVSGGDGAYAMADDGFSYDPATDTWTDIPEAPIDGRSSMFTVWTGEEMIVWGGSIKVDNTLQGLAGDGAAYDPETRTWLLLPPAPLGRKNPGVAVWTGNEMIIGGNGDATDGDPGWAAYDPATDVWQSIPSPPVESSGVYQGVWTGDEVVFAAVPWAQTSDTPVVAGFGPKNRRWRLLPTPPMSLSELPVVATGKGVVFWGTSFMSMAGALYDPSTDVWHPVASFPLSRRWGFVMVGTDRGAIVWGGASTQGPFADGAVLELGP